MQKKKVLALFMSGMLGVSSSVVSAQLEPRATIMDDYCYNKIIANHDFYAESYLYASNSFLGTTAWNGSGEYVLVEANTLIYAPATEQLECTPDRNVRSGLETVMITQDAMENLGLYQMMGVDFWHYYQISGAEPHLAYQGRVEYSY